ncbi:MAG: isoamylase early set domain-containing protein [Caldilineaceae bacterium]|nr:isoamylase early set domain-containing protein [Caldilineaceae bacterium]
MIKREVVKKTNQVKLTFIQPQQDVKHRTYVLGDFNDWTPKAHPLIKRTNGTMSTSVTLEPGQCVRFRYYREDGTWFNDEAADRYEPSEHGVDNCVVEV